MGKNQEIATLSSISFRVILQMSNNNNHPLGEAPWLHVVLATGLGTGFVPFAPGTAGALLALAVWIALYYILSPVCLLWVTLFLIIVSFVLGIWTDNVMEKYWGEDPRTVVIDEFFGTWVAVTSATVISEPDYLVIVLAFVAFCLFRIIDIFKPFGCRWVDEHIHGGLGCMLDDALAGFYAFILTMFIRHIHVIEYLHDTL